LTILQIKNHVKIAEQLRADLTLAKNAYAQELARSQRDADLLREELESARTNTVEVETQAAQYRVQVEDLREDLEREQRQHADTTAEVRANNNYQTMNSSWNIQYNGNV
jgi:uncharacterized protein (DUF3084 family)